MSYFRPNDAAHFIIMKYFLDCCHQTQHHVFPDIGTYLLINCLHISDITACACVMKLFYNCMIVLYYSIPPERGFTALILFYY